MGGTGGDMRGTVGTVGDMGGTGGYFGVLGGTWVKWSHKPAVRFHALRNFFYKTLHFITVELVWAKKLW